MAKLSRKDIEDIVRDQMPGYRVVEHHAVADAVSERVTPTEGTPDLAELKRRVAQDQGGSDNPRGSKADNPGSADEGAENEDPAAPADAEGAAAGSNSADEEEAEDHMVVLAPETPPTPWDHGSKPKVVVISGKDRKIITSQG